jgi:hypothetical protein
VALTKGLTIESLSASACSSPRRTADQHRSGPTTVLVDEDRDHRGDDQD